MTQPPIICNPFTGKALLTPAGAGQKPNDWRQRPWLTDPWAYDPWTGNRRDPRDVESDPQGFLIWHPEWGDMPAAKLADDPARVLEEQLLAPAPKMKTFKGLTHLLAKADHIPGAKERRKHAHYFKACPYDEVDVYRVLKMFDVTDPCLQHALKKLLVAGGRGAGKDIRQDVQEAIDTLVRWQEMRVEEDDAAP